MSIIETIRAEVERLKKEGEKGNTLAQSNNDYESHLQWGQQIAVANGLLDFLSTLQEKSEKPINPVSEEFESEWRRYTESRKDDVSGHAVTMNIKDLARHFYELGLNARKEE